MWCSCGCFWFNWRQKLLILWGSLEKFHRHADAKDLDQCWGYYELELLNGDKRSWKTWITSVLSSKMFPVNGLFLGQGRGLYCTLCNHRKRKNFFSAFVRCDWARITKVPRFMLPLHFFQATQRKYYLKFLPQMWWLFALPIMGKHITSLCAILAGWS